MPVFTLREQLSRIRQRPGVVAAVAVGRDGLVIDTDAAGGAGEDRSEHLAALTPGLVAAAEMLADAAGAGALRSAVIEGATGYLVVLALTRDVAGLVALAPHADAGALIADTRGARAVLAAAL